MTRVVKKIQFFMQFIVTGKQNEFDKYLKINIKQIIHEDKYKTEYFAFNFLFTPILLIFPSKILFILNLLVLVKYIEKNNIRLDGDLNKRFQTALFNIREGKKIEKTNVQDAIGEYLLSANHFMSCITKLNESSISYPSTEQDIISMMDYMCNKAKKLDFTSAYFEFVEQEFKLNNTCPVVFSESTQSLLTHFNQGHIAEIENYEKMVVESSACKSDRLAAELDGKILKWEINIRKKEFKYQLRKQMESHFKYGAIYYFFSGDYRCKLEILNSLKENLAQVELTIKNLDLILRWCTLMLMKNNPLVVYKVLDYLSELFTMLRKNDYVLTDHELYYFLPYLLRKMFNSRPIVRRTVSGLFKMIAHSTNAAKCCDIIIDLMNKTDLYPLNLGCIDQLKYLISFFGLESLDHGRLMTKLCSIIRDKCSADVGRNSLAALANAKIKSVHILKQYLTEKEIEWIPEPVIERNVAEKINLKIRIEHFAPFVFTNTAHFES
ncbi:cytoskeleton-associated 5-like, partial [Brachionus plicatilis]